MSVIALILRSSALSPYGVHVNPQKDVWSTLSWNVSGLNRTLVSRAVSRTFSMLLSSISGGGQVPPF